MVHANIGGPCGGVVTTYLHTWIKSRKLSLYTLEEGRVRQFFAILHTLPALPGLQGSHTRAESFPYLHQMLLASFRNGSPRVFTVKENNFHQKSSSHHEITCKKYFINIYDYEVVLLVL